MVSRRQTSDHLWMSPDLNLPTSAKNRSRQSAFITNLLLGAFLAAFMAPSALAAAPHHPTALASAAATARSPTNPFVEFECSWRNFTQQLDHFNPLDARTFAQRYVVCPGSWPSDPEAQAQVGTIILFLGNESPLDEPRQPIVFENAARMHALVVEVDHRYYGHSMPFEAPSRNGMFPTELLQWLTLEQVLEDSKTVLESVRSEYGVPSQVPAVVIGGSYGGDLAVYHRLKYPDTYQAAVAASAPVTFVRGTAMLNNTQQRFHDVIGKAVTTIRGNTTCTDAIRTAFEEILGAGEGRQLLEIGTSIGLCNESAALRTHRHAISLVQNIYYAFAGNAVQLNGQLPASLHSVQDFCDVLEQSLTHQPTAYVAAVGAAARVANGMNATDCYPFDNTYISITNPSHDAGYASYMYQCCTQGFIDQTMLASTGAQGSLMPPLSIPTSLVQQECRQAFGPGIPPLRAPTVAAEVDEMLRQVGQVLFTNGGLDGWGGGSLKEAIPGVKMAVISYEGASHCTDTHSGNWGNGNEPPEYRRQRAHAMDAATEWMEEFRVTAMASETRQVDEYS